MKKTNEIGTEIRVILARTGMSQKELATKLGVSGGRLSRIMTENPTLGLIKRVCEKMGWSLSVGIEPGREQIVPPELPAIRRYVCSCAGIDGFEAVVLAASDLDACDLFWSKNGDLMVKEGKMRGDVVARLEATPEGGSK